MGLFDFLFGNNGTPKKSCWGDADKNEDWFDHSGEEHDNEDGHCTECDEDEEDLED